MELLTVSETAHALRVTLLTVRRYIATGRLPAVKVGKGVRVRKEAIDQLVQPVEPKIAAELSSSVVSGRPTSAEDPLWSIIGIGESHGPADVAFNKKQNLAKASAAEGQ